jgi:cell division protein FtsN
MAATHPPASATPGAPAATGRAPAATGYAVQLGAFGTPGSANREWERLKFRYAAKLAGLTPQVVRAGTSSGLYRLQARASGEAQARSICEWLKAQSQPCVPVIPR